MGFKLILKPIFLEYDIPLAKERQNTYDRLNKICKNGMISVYDFKHNPLWVFAAHELAAIVDPDMATKMTVQFNLFGGTVLKLGTEVSQISGLGFLCYDFWG